MKLLNGREAEKELTQWRSLSPCTTDPSSDTPHGTVRVAPRNGRRGKIVFYCQS